MVAAKSISFADVYLEGYDRKFTSGNDIVSVSVTLGQDDKSSSCVVSVYDKDAAIAAALVKHSLQSGGIPGLPDVSNPAKNPDSDTASITASSYAGNPISVQEWKQAIVQECIAQRVTDVNQIAYILATAQGESSMGQNMVEGASGASYEGNSGLGNTGAGDGKRYKGRGLVQLTGKANYQAWSKLLAVDLLNNPDLVIQAKYALKILVVGMRDGRFTSFGGISRFISPGSMPDFIGARKLVNPGAPLSNAQALAGYAQRFVTEVPALMQAGGIATANLQPKTPVVSDPTPQGIIKGNKLIVNISSFSFEFFHQGTSTSNRGVTTLTGQGIRYVMNRRVRNQSFESLRLSDLVTKVAKAHGVQAQVTAGQDVTYQYVDQTGISDYALLKRECEKAGLFLSESKSTLVVKSLKDIKDTKITLQSGINLVSWDVKDVAVDSLREDKSTSLLQSESKVKLNPVTGQFEAILPDIDVTKDNAVTGSDKPKANSTLVPGQEASVDVARARKKRVKGLPSTFVLPLSDESLGLAPMDAIRTAGLSGYLSRIWMIDAITHEVDKGTTTLSCYSPIEVIDNSPQIASSSSPTVGQDAAFDGASSKGQAIYKAASALRGFSSRGGAGGGTVACVWAVNRVFQKAGLRPPWGDSEAVYVAQQAMDKAAISVPAAQAQPGDIAIWNASGAGVGGGQHIGVVMGAGGTEILSNSSGKRSFSWSDSVHNYEAYYNVTTRFYRIK